MEDSAPSSPSRRFGEVLDKLVELKKVYEVNSILMKKQDEEIDELKTELSAYKQQLASVEMELQGMYQESKKELKEAKEIIEDQIKQIMKMETLNKQIQNELTYEKDTNRENSEQIDELHNLLFKTLEDLDKMNEENQEILDRLNTSNLNFETSDDKRNEEFSAEDYSCIDQIDSKAALSPALSPIPEENIDEIPDYYDEWFAFILKFRSQLNVLFSATLTLYRFAFQSALTRKFLKKILRSKSLRSQNRKQDSTKENCANYKVP